MREADLVMRDLTCAINELQPDRTPVTVKRVFGHYQILRGVDQVRPVAPYKDTVNFLEGIIYTLKGV